MSIHFHPLAIKEITRETPDCVSVSFLVPEQLKETFRFSAGQNLTLRAFIQGQDIRRSYSICSAPHEGELRVAIKKVEGGLFSNFANEQLKAGDSLDVMPPVGKFSLPPHISGKPRHFLAVAAGSGITPIISLIKSALHSEPGCRFTLVYGNRQRGSIIFSEALEGIKNSYLDRFNLIHILSREHTDAPLHSGRIDREKLEELARLIPYAYIDGFFLCGPEEMIFTARDYFIEKGIDSHKIHFELFNSRRPPAKAASLGSGNAPDAIATVTVRLDGRSFNFPMPMAGKTSLLDAALQQGADLPFACKGGMCCTCKARLTEGEVTMDVHWGLDEEEIAKGFILTCQAHPTSEKLSVDFDQR